MASLRPKHRRWPRVLAVVALVLLALVLLWDWNWFRPLIETQASAALGRKVTLGHFDVKLSRYPQVLLDRIDIANPKDGFPANTSTATVNRLALRFDFWALFHHGVILKEVVVDQPAADLERTATGADNWSFGSKDDPSAPQPSPWKVDIGSLVINDGHAHVIDPKLKSDFTLAIHTQANPSRTEPDLYVGIEGKYAGQPIDGRFIGGSVLGLRDPNDRYPVDLKLAHANTHVSLQGTLLDPVKFAGADLKLQFTGDDLSNLYPLTGIPLVQTPPYKIDGQLDYDPAAKKVRFSKFTGNVGSSDLEGDIEVLLGSARPQTRPRFSADLNSHKVVLADLRGFIGAPPGKDHGEEKLSAQQQKQHAQQDATGKLLPDKPINLPKLRSMDFDVRYKGEHIESESTPLDNFVANLKIEDGNLSLQPLSFGVGTGSIVLNLKLDGQENLVHVAGDVDFRKVDLSRIMASTKLFKGAGTIGGKARIDTTGNSLAQMLGRGDGDLKLFMSGGDLSALLLDLAGLDFGNGIESALGIPSRAQLRCLVTDFGLNKGQVETRTFIFDTTEANVTGSGTIDLANEQIDYKLTTEPKHFNIGSLPAPILISGPLKSPSIRPDPKALAIRGGAAVVLGVLLTPLAALLPTIQLGLGQNHNCDELMNSVQGAAKIVAQQHMTPPKDLPLPKGVQKPN